MITRRLRMTMNEAFNVLITATSNPPRCNARYTPACRDLT